MLVETPPRAWGRRAGGFDEAAKRRNTPTGVGKTSRPASLPETVWKHPHGRGEDVTTRRLLRCRRETPPQAWGRPCLNTPISARNGNTPTGVGKTVVRNFLKCSAQKHPHGRGEDMYCSKAATCAAETPPRAWGRRDYTPPAAMQERNTPTGVGKTCVPQSSTANTWKHPHGRGEDTNI